jgi:hypothetical protein
MISTAYVDVTICFELSEGWHVLWMDYVIITIIQFLVATYFCYFLMNPRIS